MKRCFACGGETLAEKQVEECLEVAGKTFLASIPALVCSACGEVYYPGPALEAFELDAAGELARHGEVAAEGFRFMRRVLGMKAGELAELLDVTHETVSGWEHGHQPVERRAAALLSGMVLDRIEGRSATLDRLRALLEPEPLPTHVGIELRSA